MIKQRLTLKDKIQTPKEERMRSVSLNTSAIRSTNLLVLQQVVLHPIDLTSIKSFDLRLRRTIFFSKFDRNMIEDKISLLLMRFLLKMFEMKMTRSILEKLQSNLFVNLFRLINQKKNLPLLLIRPSLIEELR